jgi:hypothetical protein
MKFFTVVHVRDTRDGNSYGFLSPIGIGDKHIILKQSICDFYEVLDKGTYTSVVTPERITKNIKSRVDKLSNLLRKMWTTDRVMG